MAAFTLPTSPRTMVVTYAPPIWIVLMTSTLAALHIASVASTRPVHPRVSIRPRAWPYELLPSAINHLVIFSPQPVRARLRPSSLASCRLDHHAGAGSRAQRQPCRRDRPLRRRHPPML